MRLLQRLSLTFILFIALSLFAAGCDDDDDDNDDSDPVNDDAANDDADDDINDDDQTDDDDDSATFSIESNFLTVKVHALPFGLQVMDKEKGNITETLDWGSGDSLFYYRNAKCYTLASFSGKEDMEGGLELRYVTGEGDGATVTVRFHTPKSVEVSFSLDRKDGFMWAVQDMQLFDGEAIYGLAERIHWAYSLSEQPVLNIGSLNRRGQWFPMILQATIGVYTPFYQSSRGYGLYMDTTFYGFVDAGAFAPDRLRFQFQAGTDHDIALRYYIHYGPSHDEILDEYTALTGRPFIPPKWAFKHWRWRDTHEIGPGMLDGHEINGQLAEDVIMYDDLEFPIGNYMIDRPYTPGDQGFAEFAWDPVRFPNADHMRQSLFDRGYHLIVWGAPWAIGFEEGQNGWEAQQNGYHAPHQKKHIDFTNPEAYEWWKNKVRDFALENNIHGWKLDRGDEDQPSLWWDIYWDGRSGAEMRNAYPLAYHKNYYDAMMEAWDGDFVNIIRAGWSGSQSWGIPWAGDTRAAYGDDPDGTDLGLRSLLLSQLHCSMMGFPIWTNDTGGYREFRDREVFARWLQFSALSTMMEIGGDGAHAPWDMPTNPNYDEEMIDIYRTYTTLHHDLVDYIYDYALGSADTGRAVVRPLVFDYPNDPNVLEMWDEYFLGEDILVAPVWESGRRERDVYIPQGEFVDYWNPGATITGPTTINADAPLDQIPFYIRKGTEVLGRVW